MMKKFYSLDDYMEEIKRIFERLLKEYKIDNKEKHNISFFMYDADDFISYVGSIILSNYITRDMTSKNDYDTQIGVYYMNMNKEERHRLENISIMEAIEDLRDDNFTMRNHMLSGKNTKHKDHAKIAYSGIVYPIYNMLEVLVGYITKVDDPVWLQSFFKYVEMMLRHEIGHYLHDLNLITTFGDEGLKMIEKEERKWNQMHDKKEIKDDTTSRLYYTTLDRERLANEAAGITYEQLNESVTNLGEQDTDLYNRIIKGIDDYYHEYISSRKNNELEEEIFDAYRKKKTIAINSKPVPKRQGIWELTVTKTSIISSYNDLLQQIKKNYRKHQRSLDKQYKSSENDYADDYIYIYDHYDELPIKYRDNSHLFQLNPIFDLHKPEERIKICDIILLWDNLDLLMLKNYVMFKTEEGIQEFISYCGKILELYIEEAINICLDNGDDFNKFFDQVEAISI